MNDHTNKPSGATSGGKKSNYKKRNNRSRKPGSNAPQNASPNQPKTGGDHKPGNKKRKRFNKPLTPEKIHTKYDNLLEQHLTARRKFFELNGRANTKQIEKARHHFYRTIEDLRKFESNLKDWQKESLETKTESYPMENSYTETHELPKHTYDNVLTILSDGDPHLLPVQRDSSFSHDTEETLGTMEDYMKYKDL